MDLPVSILSASMATGAVAEPATVVVTPVGSQASATGPADWVAEIARALHLSEGTVRNHLSAAIGKTGARNRADAARIADQNGWL